MAGPDIELAYGQINCGVKTAQWFCPACVGRWESAVQSARRLVVFGWMDDKVLWCAYIGQTDASMDAAIKQKDPLPAICDSAAAAPSGVVVPPGPDTEKEDRAEREVATKGDRTGRMDIQINLLKGAQLLQELNGEPITKESLLEALKRLNAECDSALMAAANVHILKTGDHKQTKFYDRKLYCDNDATSAPRSGMDFKALIVPTGGIPTLTPEGLQTILDWCAQFIDIDVYLDGAKKISEPAKRKELRRWEEQRDAKRGRSA